MKTKILMSAILVLTLSLAACAPKGAPTPAGKTVAPTEVKAPSKVPPAPTAQPKPAPTKSAPATPITLSTDSISVKDQAISGDAVLISSVIAEKAAWVAIFTDENGTPATLVGHVSVPAGTTKDLKIPVDPKKATGKMIAMLLIDAGSIGKFEYPGADVPVTAGGKNVMAEFRNMSTGYLHGLSPA